MLRKNNMSELSNLPNIGKVLENNLLEIGIKTTDELRKTGSKKAFLKIRADVDPGACLHMLYGIEGAIEGIRYTDLESSTKEDLKRFFNLL
jgi:DNA transformation protein